MKRTIIILLLAAFVGQNAYSQNRIWNETEQEIRIKAPNFGHLKVDIIGTAPLVGNKFSAKARQGMMDGQAKGATTKGRKERQPKDFDDVYQQHRHISTEGWDGIPAIAIKAAMVSACRTVGYKMTWSKLAFQVLPDGFDADDRSALIRITKGEPQRLDSYVRLTTGVADIVSRPLWESGWEATVNVRYDADMLTAQDICNLLARAGEQVGILAGRPDSRMSVGQGWGTFKLGGKS